MRVRKSIIMQDQGGVVRVEKVKTQLQKKWVQMEEKGWTFQPTLAPIMGKKDGLLVGEGRQGTITPVKAMEQRMVFR